MQKMHTGIKSYYNISRINNAADEVSIDLIGVVGDWWEDKNTKEQFINKLKGISASNIILNISSPGGAVYDALAIYDAFKGHPARVTARLSGLVASAASFIALAADEVVASPTTLYMIHNVWGMAIGNKEELAKEVGVMGKHDEVIAQIYKKKTGKNIATIRKWMRDETWFSADEALANGFVDRIEEGLAFADEVTIENQQARDFLTTHMNCTHLPTAQKQPENKEETMDFSNEEKGMLRKLVSFFNKSEKVEIEDTQVDQPETDQPEAGEVENLKAQVADLQNKLEEKEQATFENLINGIANALNGKIEEAVNNATTEVKEATESLANSVEEVKQEIENQKQASEETASKLNAKVEDLAKGVNNAKALGTLPENPKENGEGLEKKVAPENSFLSFVRANNN